MHPEYFEPTDLNTLPDALTQKGRDKKTIYGFFNRAAARLLVRSGPESTCAGLVAWFGRSNPTCCMPLYGDRAYMGTIQGYEWGPAFFGTVCNGGGAVVNTSCETSLPGLFACGDAMARPGCHRSLQGATVSGARAGRFAAEYVKKAKKHAVNEKQVEKWKKAAYRFSKRKDGILPDHLIIGVLEQLVPYGITVISRGDRLENAIKAVEWMRDNELPLVYAPDPHYLRLANEVSAMVLVAEMYLKSRLLRTESRGMCTTREDYPYTDNVNWLKWTRLKLEKGEMKLWTEDVPLEKYEVKPARENYLYPLFAVATKRGISWG